MMNADDVVTSSGSYRFYTPWFACNEHAQCRIKSSPNRKFIIFVQAPETPVRGPSSDDKFLTPPPCLGSSAVKNNSRIRDLYVVRALKKNFFIYKKKYFSIYFFSFYNQFFLSLKSGSTAPTFWCYRAKVSVTHAKKIFFKTKKIFFTTLHQLFSLYEQVIPCYK